MVFNADFSYFVAVGHGFHCILNIIMQIEMKKKMELSKRDQEAKVSHVECTQLYMVDNSIVYYSLYVPTTFIST